MMCYLITFVPHCTETRRAFRFMPAPPQRSGTHAEHNQGGACGESKAGVARPEHIKRRSSMDDWQLRFAGRLQDLEVEYDINDTEPATSPAGGNMEKSRTLRGPSFMAPTIEEIQQREQEVLNKKPVHLRLAPRGTYALDIQHRRQMLGTRGHSSGKVGCRVVVPIVSPMNGV